MLSATAWVAAPVLAKPVTEPVGQRVDRTPDEMQGVGIDEHPGAQVPLDLKFIDENGQPVQLKQYFANGKRPVILQLGYYDCPMLCSLVSQGAVESLKALKLEAGSDYDYLFVSINPDEKPSLAFMKKTSYIKEFNRPLDASGWHFLTGREEQIKELAASVGWKYKWLENQHQFSHPAAVILLSPDGKVTRYLYGVKFPGNTLRLSLVEASHGKIGSTLDQIILTCAHFDPSSGKYTWAAIGLMRIAAGITILVLGLFLYRTYRRARRGEPTNDIKDSDAHDAPGAPA